MNLQTHIRPNLWEAVSNTYQAGNYSHAILDAMHYLSDVIREKSNVDADGVQLVGQAFGSDTPRLRINKLQTETERNIQRGFEQIIRGLYMAVRNPRSHEQIEDSKDTSDSIICFINYIITILDKSEEPFTFPKFLARVFDSDFVETERYAELLVDEIPPNKRTDALIEIYRDRVKGEGQKLKYVCDAIFDRISDDQITQFLAVVSDDLKTIQDEGAIIITMQILRPEDWPRIHEVARLRIENKILRSLQEGFESERRGITRGKFAITARSFFKHFSIKEQISQTLIARLKEWEQSHRLYVTRNFFRILPDVLMSEEDIRRYILTISSAVRDNDKDIILALLECMHDYPENWQKALVENLRDLTDDNNPAIYLVDGTPFLTESLIPEDIQVISDEDIPF